MSGPVYRTVGWKYTLTFQFNQTLPERIAAHIDDRKLLSVDPYFAVHADSLVVREGYAWDGASGPTIDTDNTMRAALVHDVLYQTMRLGALDIRYRRRVDILFRRLLKEDGVNGIRRWYWYKAVRWFGKSSAQMQADA